MTFSYNAATVGTVSLDLLRLLLQDTDPATASFSDEEIDGLITALGDACSALGALCNLKAVRLGASEVMSESVGDLSISRSGSSQFWRDIGPSLEARCRAGIGGAMEAVGIGPNGLPWAELPHIFRVGMHERYDTSNAPWSSEEGLNFEGTR